MSHKSRAITVAFALAVGLGLPASVAMAPAPVTEPTPTVSDIELVPVAEPIETSVPVPSSTPSATPAPSQPTGPVPSCVEEDSLSCVWVADERGNGEGESYVTDGEGNVTYISHDEARAILDPSTVDLTDDRDPELWEEESAPWEWSQLLPDEAYIWPRCDDFYQSDCVWVASEHKVQGAAESFIALGDGDVIPLNESQALVMVGG